jgi:hypothetical protein
MSLPRPIVSRGDIMEAMQKLEANRRENLTSHEIGHVGDFAPNDSTSTHQLIQPHQLSQ